MDIDQAIGILRDVTAAWDRPVVEELAEATQDPFKVLIATILSLRTKDTTLVQIVPRLFSIAETPEAMLQVAPDQIEQAIYPVGFYRNKTRNILEVCRLLVENHDGQVPADLDSLLALPGVGRKTANLVLGVSFGIPAICVDTHVHRIPNRWGYIRTRTPEETEMALRNRLPEKFWIEINRLLVPFGQNQCLPVSPKCNTCPLLRFCEQVGVARHR